LPLLLSRIHRVYLPDNIRGFADTGDEDVTALQAMGEVVCLCTEHSETMIACPRTGVKVHSYNLPQVFLLTRDLQSRPGPPD
jgi:hypothetical protein